MAVLTVGVLLWLAIGALVVLVMARRGHSPWTWTWVGLVLGPLAVPLALDARADRRSRLAVTSGRTQGSGPVSVIAGIDGSPEAIEAVREALALLGDRAGRVRLVAVVHQDAASNTLMFDEERAAAEGWLASASEATDGSAEQLVVAGDPVAVLTGDLATGFDLIVIGPRGRGLSRRVFGSVAARLPQAAKLPVLVGGRHGRAEASSGTSGAAA